VQPLLRRDPHARSRRCHVPWPARRAPSPSAPVPRVLDGPDPTGEIAVTRSASDRVIVMSESAEFEDVLGGIFSRIKPDLEKIGFRLFRIESVLRQGIL